MIKYFESSNNSCHVLLDSPLKNDDALGLVNVLQKEYDSWDIEFGRVYNVNKEIIKVLYHEIFEKNNKITITVHKSKLYSYFHGLGFHVKFESLLKQDIIEVSKVEVVLIGGSADSTSKIINIVKSVDFNNLALAVVQHVEENRNGIFDTILQTYTKARVKYAQDAEVIEKGTIYLAPNNHHLKVKEGKVYLSDEEKYNFSKPSVSLSYESFSSYYKEKLLVIQECGYANDGVDKLEYIKSNGTKLIVQKEDECEAKPMVSNALAVNQHDYVLTTKDIIYYIGFLDKDFAQEDSITYFLEMISLMHSYDFRLYNREMMQRRINIFMLKHDIKIFKDAVGMILFNKSVFKSFFLEVSINVTELFRKPKSYELLRDLLSSRYENTHNLKFWSAGCSSGEEAYSLAILLNDIKLLDKSIIYATDFNEVVLKEAENGLYALKDFLKAQENYEKIGFNNNLDEYLTKNNNYMEVIENIRKKTLFFKHNLVLDSSFNEFDIIICKNVVIYFNEKLQDTVFKLFYDSLKFGGHLVLGESEMLSAKYIDKFQRCSDDCKIFRKIA